MPKNIKLPINKKIFSAYVDFDFESMHLKNTNEENNRKYN
jgi:hypothetical protein